jgi:hypothetical protein
MVTDQGLEARFFGALRCEKDRVKLPTRRGFGGYYVKADRNEYEHSDFKEELVMARQGKLRPE